VEETLEAFLKECGKPTIEAFTEKYTHSFLYRETFTGSTTRKLTDEEIQEKTRRFEKLVGRNAGYVLMQSGYRSMEGLLKEAVASGAQKLEPRIVRVRRAGAAVGAIGAVCLGAGDKADVKLPGKGIADLAVMIAPSDDKKDFMITKQGGDLWYGGERMLDGKPVPLEEGLALQLGPETTYQTFSSIGFLRYLSFRLRMERMNVGAETKRVSPPGSLS
jgi:hypothetical protein